MRTRLVPVALAVLALSVVPARAATFFAEFWDAPSAVTTLNAAQAIVASGGPTATFQSSSIDYPNGSRTKTSSNGKLSSYLGVDAASLTGAGDTKLKYSVFRFSGFLDLDAGQQVFSVGSDDGFELSIDGQVISSFTRNRGFRRTTKTVDAGQGVTPFTLLYWENKGNTGVEFKVDGALAQASSFDLGGFAGAAPSVPLPGGMVLLLGALGVFGIARRVRAR